MIILDGFAVATKRTRDGTQQNVAIHVGGDVIGQDGYALGAALADVTALTTITFIRLAHNQLAELLDFDPRFAQAFWRQGVLQGAIGREWVLNMARRSAMARMAHLFCEVAFRLHPTGGDNLSSFTMPLTQVALGETLGLSAVHVNRTLQTMRKEGLIVLKHHRLTIPDWQRLVEVAEFESSCLIAVG